MQPFSGFPAGKQTLVRVPNAFFTDLLPAIDDLVEIKVTLYCLWLLNHKQGDLRYTRLSELAADDLLVQGVASKDEDGVAALRRGLERAEARGVLLRVKVKQPTGDEDWYFLNSELGRAAVERIRRGELHKLAEPVPEDVSLQAQRPHIYLLYEHNIGVIQPMIAEELREAERTYPAPWIEDAFREAVELNKRSWRYIRRILERWAAEGKDDGIDWQRAQADDDSYEALKRRYVPSGYEDLGEH
jgi:DnaD/phage-associated family protein